MHIKIHIQYHTPGRKGFHAGLHLSKSTPLNIKSVLETMIRSPITTMLTMPRILYEAYRLHYKKGNNNNKNNKNKNDNDYDDNDNVNNDRILSILLFITRHIYLVIVLLLLFRSWGICKTKPLE